MKNVNRILFRLSLMAVLLAGAGLVNAELVVIVNPGNPVTSISAKDLSRLYLGKARSFPGAGRAQPINQAAGSAARKEFFQTYANMSEAQVKGYWSKLMFSGKGRPPAELADDAAVKAAVAGDASAVGYIDAAAVDQSVKTLSVTP